ncbi:class I SAM-dependent methyltransferase [Candidatus Pelagibacter sp. Uisw_127]|uniref:class I SAM-dependent methyltransferase n=1 Tax=Candidatus Pelagibacter sp. Uisw_127 TaxID=3230988 RepID=UPI0039ED61C6
MIKITDFFTKEPRTYTELNESLNISSEEYHKKILENKMDSHTQIKDAPLFSRRLEIFIKQFFFDRGNKTIILDCGCGLGLIGMELEKYKNFEVFLSEPSESIKKIIDTIYPNKKFLPFPIEKIPKEFNNFFDVIYLREVYPFTRSNDISLHTELIKMLNEKLKKNGILIFEQIKNSEDLFDNLEKLKIIYKKFYLLPVRCFNFRWFHKIYFNIDFLSSLTKLAYKLSNKKINHYIVVKKY